MKQIITYTALILAGIIIGIMISTKYCSKPIEIVKVEVKHDSTVVYKTDTIIKEKKVTTEVKIPVEIDSKGNIKTVYKDSLVTIIDSFPMLDSSCLAQLDSIKRKIVIAQKEKEITKEKIVTNNTTKTITITEPKKKVIYLGSGIMYNRLTKDYLYNYNIGYQFKNKILLTLNGNVNFKSKTYIPDQYSVNLYVPIIKFK